MYARLQARGHEVRVHIGEESSRDVHGGMLQLCEDWREELDWIRAAGQDGILLFESADRGEIQDELRGDGFQVIGGSALGDRLEADREFGQDIFRTAGLQTANSHAFQNYDHAIDFLQRSSGRHVVKFNGANSPRTRNYVGEMNDAQDVIALLSMYREHGVNRPPPDFVLMQHVQGIEVGIGAYFNGRQFMDAICIDFEHKRLFPGELGELTGEMGTVVSYRGGGRLFRKILAPLTGLLRDGGYVGYINVNLIVNEDGLWPLEFTSRFGYPGYAICERLHGDPWEHVFSSMLQGKTTSFKTRQGYSVGVVLTVPPFPYTYGYSELSKGEPICFRSGFGAQDAEALFLAEVASVRDILVTSGCSGYVGVATGIGDSISTAAQRAYSLAAKVVVPNLRYRNDIGQRVSNGDWKSLQELGWIDESGDVF
ncbi:MAG: phosphoribosylamine--glycine ligase [Pseudomonadota bacterium]